MENWLREVFDCERVIPGTTPRLWEARQLPNFEYAIADESFHDEEARIYDSYLDNPRVAYAEAWIVPWIIQHICPGIVLDLGAGTGRIAQAAARLPNRRVIAIDRSRVMLKRTITKTRELSVIGLRADISELPIQDASVDAVVCSGVLHHLRTPEAAIEETARVLRPGGALIIREPNAEYPETWFAPLENCLATLYKRFTTSKVVTSDNYAPYEKPIAYTWLKESHNDHFELDFLGTAKFLASFALPEGFPGARAFYRTTNFLDRACFLKLFSRHGSLVLSVAKRAPD